LKTGEKFKVAWGPHVSGPLPFKLGHLVPDPFAPTFLSVATWSPRHHAVRALRRTSTVRAADPRGHRPYTYAFASPPPFHLHAAAFASVPCSSMHRLCLPSLATTEPPPCHRTEPKGVPRCRAPSASSSCLGHWQSKPGNRVSRAIIFLHEHHRH
jgi:hypothetical protein